MQDHSRTVLLVDLDGTLTDPAEGIIGCFRAALEALGLVAPATTELGWIIGPPLRQSFWHVSEGKADPEEALRMYRARYDVDGLFQATVHGGVQEALAELNAAGARLILCTAKPAVCAVRILSHFGLDHHFEAAYGAELDGTYEDKGDLIARILEERQLEADACCMLGDREHDVIAAKRHGIPTIGALWGYGGEAELSEAGAAALCATPAEIVAAFMSLPRPPPLRTALIDEW
ncbi:MAG TPA: HAD hydrolase-like protein [Roseiarcus sp.]|nr:HAD hydrolase-like protein [Roseiarcus sp.]